jgi:hypothetical protein
MKDMDLIIAVVCLVAFVGFAFGAAMEARSDMYKNGNSKSKCSAMDTGTSDGSPCGRWSMGYCYKGKMKNGKCAPTNVMPVAAMSAGAVIFLIASIVFLVRSFHTSKTAVVQNAFRFGRY